LEKTLNSLIALFVWPIAAVVFALSAGAYLLTATLIPPKRIHPLARLLCRLMLLGAGQIIKVKGTTPNTQNGPYLYLFNHQSMLDPFIVGSTVTEYISAVGGDFQFSWPIWGRLIKRYGAIPIVRKNLHEAINSLNLAEKEIHKGTSFLISPEGTRTITGKMGIFKKGPFHMSLNTGVTIIPIGIIGAFNSKRRNDWRINPGIINVNIGKPLRKDYYKNMSVEELRDNIRNKIALLCNDEMVTPLEIE